jgi:hypothetical protein
MTAGELWYEATRDVQNETANIEHFERNALITFEIRNVGTVLYPYFSSFYERTDVFVPKVISKYLKTGTGTWTAATRRLAGTLNIGFVSEDQESIVIFRIGTGAGAQSYLAHIETVVSSSIAVVKGTQLPVADGTVNAIEVPPTVLGADGIALSYLSMMRTGAQFHIKLESSVTDFIDPMSHDELQRWDSTDRKNQGRIGWTLSGDLILMKKGSDLSTYGTVVLRYPGLPYPVVNDNTDIDLPDGAPQGIALLKLKRRLRERYGSKPMPEYESMMKNQVEMLLGAYGLSANTQEVRKTVEALN